MPHSARKSDDLLAALEQFLSKRSSDNHDSHQKKDPENKFWETYLRAMKDEDEERPRDWDGNTGSILTFSGLFAATVAAFIIESYKSLSPDSGDQTVLLLSHLVNATTNATASPTLKAISIEPFQLTISTILVNALWFCSLLTVLACALLATLVQQWSRDYTRDIRRRDSIDESLISRAYNHVYIRMGVDRYGMDEVVNVLVALVHLSVFLFAAGLLLFLFPINFAVVWCAVSVLCVLGLAYIAASLLSIFDTSSPYRTPLTYPLSFVRWLLGHCSRFIRGVLLRRDLHPVLETALQWCNAALPSFSRDFITRRRVVYTSLPNDAFLSVARFKFAWDHTSRQMFDGNMKTLLQFVMTKLVSISNDVREPCIAHLENDGQLKSKLVRIGSFWEGHMDYEASVVGYRMCCLLFQRFYERYRKADIYGRDRHALNRYLQVFLSGLTTSSITTHSAYSTLTTRFCLYYMRWHLLLAHSEEGGEDFVIKRDALQLMSDVYPEEHDQYKERTDEITPFRYASIDRPWQLLYLMNSYQVNSMDAKGHKDYGDVEESGRSCLIPLHDGACCRQNDTTRHVAACNVLTMIAHIIAAPEPARMELFRRQHEYDVLLNHGDSPFTQWIDHTEMEDVDRQKAPSAEFLDVLRSVNLHKWSDPGSNFDYSPSFGTPEGRLLNHRISENSSKLDTVVSPPSPIFTIVDVLRALARRVDFSALPDPHARTPPSGPDPGVGAIAVSDTESSSDAGPSDPPPDSKPALFAVTTKSQSPAASRSTSGALIVQALKPSQTGSGASVVSSTASPRTENDTAPRASVGEVDVPQTSSHATGAVKPVHRGPVLLLNTVPPLSPPEATAISTTLGTQSQVAGASPQPPQTPDLPGQPLASSKNTPLYSPLSAEGIAHLIEQSPSTSIAPQTTASSALTIISPEQSALQTSPIPSSSAQPRTRVLSPAEELTQAPRPPALSLIAPQPVIPLDDSRWQNDVWIAAGPATWGDTPTHRLDVWRRITQRFGSRSFSALLEPRDRAKEITRCKGRLWAAVKLPGQTAREAMRIWYTTIAGDIVKKPVPYTVVVLDVPPEEYWGPKGEPERVYEVKGFTGSAGPGPSGSEA
ncbi:unnamed protein product [Peniophora sp. CBMAI 1063]|nr:unnamed protein product [Peniophora sp. CBMAI 1063]